MQNIKRKDKMTICIAAICKESSTLILATDSMLTNEALSIQFEHPVKKMTYLSNNCVALTAGDALAHTELFNIVQKKITKLKEPSVIEVVTKIKECYQGIRKIEIIEKFLNPRGFNTFNEFYQAQGYLSKEVIFTIQAQIDTYNYGLQILVGGISNAVAHIYLISDPGTSKCFDAIGFSAIGSGLPHAINTLIARGCNQNISLEEGFMIVYEAKKMAEKAPGVGSNITNICIINSKGISEFPQNKFRELHKIYEKWVRRESDWEDDLGTLLIEMGVFKK